MMTFIEDKQEKIHLSKDYFYESFSYFSKLQQKRIFLNRSVKSYVLLPSNSKRDMEFDILLMQQKRRVAASLKKIETVLRDFDIDWNTLSKRLQLKLIRFKTDM